jgi:glutathione peroxidase
MTDLSELPVTTLQGRRTTFGEIASGRVTLVVNVASRCGYTPQYAGLEALHRELSGRGFGVIGFPCNQFGAQEPGTETEIAEFCLATYGITFPMSAKVDVNGPDRDPVWSVLTAAPYAAGEPGPDAELDEPSHPGDVEWNFEKFLVTPDGRVAARFRAETEPDDPRLRAHLESLLPR